MIFQRVAEAAIGPSSAVDLHVNFGSKLTKTWGLLFNLELLDDQFKMADTASVALIYF